MGWKGGFQMCDYLKKKINNPSSKTSIAFSIEW